jgi:hypothetical protein
MTAARVAESTREQYERHLDEIDAVWGDDPVANLTTVDVQKAIDGFKETPSAGRVFRSVLSRLCSWGMRRASGRRTVRILRYRSISSRGALRPHVTSWISSTTHCQKISSISYLRGYMTRTAT